MYRSPVTAIQMIQMCRAFSHAGLAVTLVDPVYLADLVRPATWGTWEPYGIPDEFRRRRIPTLLFDRSHRLQGLSPLLKMVSYLPYAFVWRISWQLNRNDILYTRCYLSAALLAGLRKTLRAGSRPRLIFEVHERPSPARAAVLRQMDGLVCISKSLQASLQEIGLAGVPLTSEHDGVDLATFGRQRQTVDAARAQLGLSLEGKLIAYVGTLHADEIRVLFEAAGELSGDRARVLIVGGTPNQVDAYRREAASRGLPIEFAGLVRHSSVSLYLQSADVLVMPYTGNLRWSRHFSPLKLFEYMASGRPLVASHLPVLSEVISHGRNAVMVPAGDSHELVSGIRRVLYDPELAARISHQAQQDVSIYSWDARAKRILAFIEQLGSNQHMAAEKR